MVWFKRILCLMGAVTIIIGGIFISTRQFKLVDESNLPKFIKANPINPDLVVSVSKFRSGAGHSNPGWPEICRSMKHYINTLNPDRGDFNQANRTKRPTTNSAIDIYSPVDGYLWKTGTGEGDDQLNISVDGYPGYSIRLEHVHLNPGIAKFMAPVKADQKIATIWKGQNFDLSVFYNYYRGEMLFSYFQVLPDELFVPWQEQGAKNREEFIFTKEYRDAHPLECLNDRPGTPSFAGPDGKPTENWTDENFVELVLYQELEKERKSSY